MDKLLQALPLFCDRSGCISQAYLFLFLRSFLLALIALRKASEITESDEILSQVNRMAHEATESIVQEVLLENRVHILLKILVNGIIVLATSAYHGLNYWILQNGKHS